MYSQIANPVKLVQGGVDSVAPFITVSEQSESTQSAVFTLLLHFLLSGDHVTRIYCSVNTMKLLYDKLKWPCTEDMLYVSV